MIGIQEVINEYNNYVKEHEAVRCEFNLPSYSTQTPSMKVDSEEIKLSIFNTYLIGSMFFIILFLTGCAAPSFGNKRQDTEKQTTSEPK